MLTVTAPSDALPGLPTGVVNHIDKDSRPDLLEGINVKMEPGREEAGGERYEESVKSESAGPGLDSVAVHTNVLYKPTTERTLTFQSLYKWAREG